MKKIYVLILLLHLPIYLFAQKEFDNWFFAYNNGLSFTTGSPVQLTGGALNPVEGCASISTATGNLLFYTDGMSVDNVTNLRMPNGFGLFGATSSSQSAIIIPDPADTNLFYIFTADEMGKANGICYSKVDMSLQWGLGDVVLKNQPLLSPAHEKITAVKQSSGSGYWVIVHDLDSITSSYYAYPVTINGVGLPVISNVGLHGGILSFQGCMKVSPDGAKLVNPINPLHKVEILDFDPLTGVVSNSFLFSPGGNSSIYGTAFSATGNVLYLGELNGYPKKIYQLNLAAGSQAAILSSVYVFNTTNYQNGSFELASDGKIYLTNAYFNYLSIINNPDSVGISCNYVDSGIYFPSVLRYGLQNSISGGVQITDIKKSSIEEFSFNVSPNPVSQNVTINFNSVIRNAQLKILDLLGNIIREENISNARNIKINLLDLEAGIYFLRIFNEEKDYSKKVIVKHN